MILYSVNNAHDSLSIVAYVKLTEKQFRAESQSVFSAWLHLADVIHMLRFSLEKLCLVYIQKVVVRKHGFHLACHHLYQRQLTIETRPCSMWIRCACTHESLPVSGPNSSYCQRLSVANTSREIKSFTSTIAFRFDGRTSPGHELLYLRRYKK